MTRRTFESGYIFGGDEDVLVEVAMGAEGLEVPLLLTVISPYS